jgi:hypothetical protein
MKTDVAGGADWVVVVADWLRLPRAALLYAAHKLSELQIRSYWLN